MADQFEEGLKDLVSEQFKDGETAKLRNEETGEYITPGDNGNGNEDEEVDKDRREGAEGDENEGDEEVDNDAEEEGDEEDDETKDKKEDNDDEEDEEEKPDDKKGKKPSRFQKRVDNLTATVRRLERDLKTERDAKAAAALVPKKADGTPYASASEYAKAQLAADEKAPKKPDPTKFKLGEFDPDYSDAKDDYLDERRRYLDGKEKEYDTKTSANANAAPAAEQDEFRNKINSTIENGKKLFKDFDEVVVKGIEKDTWPLSETSARFMSDSDVGAELAYTLAKDVKLAKEIADLPPIQQVKRLTKLEDKISAEKAEAEKKRKRGSSAPAPLQQRARGGGTRETGRFDSEDFEQVEKNWNKGPGKKRE